MAGIQLPALATAQGNSSIRPTLQTIAMMRNQDRRNTLMEHALGRADRTLELHERKFEAGEARQERLTGLQGELESANEAEMPAVLRKLSIQFPVEAKQHIDGMNALSERGRTQAKDRSDKIGAFYTHIQGLPMVQRPVAYAQGRTQLGELGASLPERYDPREADLNHAVAVGSSEYLTMKKPPKAPSGYRVAGGDRLEAVPGGPADPAKVSELAKAKSSDKMFPGRGATAVFGNAILEIGPKIANGTATDEEKLKYAYAEREVTQDRIVTDATGRDVTIRGEALPAGFPIPDGKGGFTIPKEDAAEISPAGTTETLAKPILPERAGKQTLIEQAQANITDIKNAVIGPDGTIDRGLVFTMWGDVPLMGKGIPGTEGRMTRARMEDASSAKLRLETGAQANEGEITGIIDRFMPSPFDDDATIKDKLTRMETFFNTALSKTNPALYAKLEKRAGAAKATGAKDINKMSLGELKKMDIKAMSADDLEKASKRYKELSLGR
jgi:hypothetical protein